MAESSSPRRGLLGGIARNAAISILIGVAFVFVIFVGRQEFWGWRLLLWGAVTGVAVYSFSHLLNSAVGERIRRLGLVPDKVVGVPLYFIGGCAGFIATTALLRAFGVMPFTLSGRDLWLALLINGGLSIVVGLLFYSSAVMRRRLQDSIERIKEQEFAEKELALARSIQTRLLPPALVEGDGYRVTAKNLPARFVAGDFYDVFHLPDGTLGLVVADVSGKGIGAALIMASVKAVVPLLAAGSAAQTLTRLNRKLASELSAREFVALCFARFDPASGSLEIANAGLPDPYRLSHDGLVEPLEVPGPRLPLGARREVAYEVLRVALSPGDRILIVTDGLPEAPAANAEPLGYEALARLIDSAARNGENLLDNLFASVRRATTSSLEDDWTALLLERRPIGTGA